MTRVERDRCRVGKKFRVIYLVPENESKDIMRRNSKKIRNKNLKRRRLLIIGGPTVAVLVVGSACAVWLGATASGIKSELEIATSMVPSLKSDLAANRPAEAAIAVEKLKSHTANARKLADNPIWTLASTLPGAGQNFSAVSEVARAADDVATLGLGPLVRVFSVLDWKSLLPGPDGSDLKPLKAAAPFVTSSSQAVRLSADRLDQIDDSKLIAQVAEPLIRARGELREVTGALSAAANASTLLPSMLGSDEPRNYLLIVQNNAETRASGGIPGALAVLNFDQGKLTLAAQSSAGEVGVMTPPVPTEASQQQIYSARLGKFMQDVNLTPDFPTAAASAKAMWERKTGQSVDGVVSVDPIALAYLLEATGPLELNKQGVSPSVNGLPTTLTSKNVVQTLLSDVYSKIEQPALQDKYFAGVAQEIFTSLSSGNAQAGPLFTAMGQSTAEGRLLVWSARTDEQSAITRYPLSGAVAGPSVAPAQFGVYFNDGTGAKMDYYVKRTVQLVRDCPQDGYEKISVRIVSTNTAPADAAKTLPSYVTGGGHFGVPPGTVQTNVIAYGPAQAHIESATLDGQKSPFAPYMHASRPVGVIAQLLAPGESKTVEFHFAKIVQHTEPNLVVTPTVQPVKDVVLPAQDASCRQG
ncbi:DUF4012 domain-containing protein [Pseudarthrobacter sp. SL88]|uniref:DUF4012 domain-containing protein n=1 Tax=Pseudarthrobacter sp. SL88 TaxID=2994666 RepID=UPI002272CA24|nr:DUF4012 domain-containing protein [Pseudarthrobacter sp. SL88]MCY1673805.1 DUF4012 domain-containing protein [Pseudarthrobacter sp. SL88]